MYKTYLIIGTIIERNMTWFEEHVAINSHQDVFFSSNLCPKVKATTCPHGIKVQSLNYSSKSTSRTVPYTLDKLFHC